METAVVRVSVAPVLAARSWRSEQVTQALLGARVEIMERGARWQRIRMQDGYEGWISGAHLASDLPATGEWVRITDMWVNLRTLPDYRMPARVTAMIGTSLPLRDQRADWLGVGLPAGGIGWLEAHRGGIHPPDERLQPPAPAELLATARRFLGVPYLWGGCSPLGLDCSGFVQLVYRLHGILLPRDADQQAEVGEPVPGAGDAPAQLASGDALFFHATAAPARISHVALALDSESFLHAAGSDRVRIDHWAGSNYGERLVCARRYLPRRCPTGPQVAVGLARVNASGQALAQETGNFLRSEV